MQTWLDDQFGFFCSCKANSISFGLRTRKGSVRSITGVACDSSLSRQSFEFCFDCFGTGCLGLTSTLIGSGFAAGCIFCSCALDFGSSRSVCLTCTGVFAVAVGSKIDGSAGFSAFASSLKSASTFCAALSALCCFFAALAAAAAALYSFFSSAVISFF